MKLKFLGAAGTVTGSCYLLETNGTRFLVDCGLWQGPKAIEDRNFLPFDFDPKNIDFLLLTHAHLDHCGLLPKLVKQGFRGKIMATDATKDLVKILLMDAAKIQEEDFERGKIDKPLYTQDDVEPVIDLFETHNYGQKAELTPRLSFRMREAGHILGSVVYEIWFHTGTGRQRKIVFSGDLGQPGERIIRDPDFIREADYIIVESTYGGRLHKDKSSTIVEFVSIVQEVLKDKSRGIVPTFAVERTQEILYELNLMVEKEVVRNLQVYLDSPLAIKATEIFRQYKKYYDEDAMHLLKSGDDPFSFKGLEYVSSVNHSKRLADKKGVLIMAGSGMCTGGRVTHHLIHHIEDPKTHILFVGFQVPGTLGRRIVDGEPKVSIFGHEVEVKAKVHTLGGFSAHADQKDLMYWLGNYGHSPQMVYITHGDDENRQALSKKIGAELGLNVQIPEWKEEVELG